MTTINLNNRKGGSASSEDRVVLPTDMYRAKCVEASVEEDTKFGKPDRDGTYPQKIVTVWEITTLTEEQADAAADAGEAWVGVRLWSRHNPYYGDVKAGGPSKFKAFIDGLRSQGMLPNFDPEAFDVGDLLDIEQRIGVEQYIKTMGENAGQPGNKITSFAPVRTRATKPNTAKAGAAAPRNVPQPATVEESEDVPF